MQNLSKTVERILKIEPSLGSQLLPIKEKWDKGPKRVIYWKQLLKILNAQITPEHPKRFDIQNLFSYKRKKVPKKLHTFESPTPAEVIIGTIPEYLESRVRRNDRLGIEFAKLAVEAKLTRNEELMIDLNKKSEKLEIDQKKLWYDIKNYFDVWKVAVPTSFFIRSKDSLLVLTAIRFTTPQQGPDPVINGDSMPDSFIIRLDNETLKKFLKYINPPPGFIPPPD